MTLISPDVRSREIDRMNTPELRLVRNMAALEVRGLIRVESGGLRVLDLAGLRSSGF